MQDYNTFHVMEDEVLFIDNLRSAKELPSMRMSYNSIVYCKTGRVVVEMGGNHQVNVAPGQLLLIPTGKMVEPLLISTDAETTALLISDRVLKSVLGNQINIWNKAMYMREIYVVEGNDWIGGMQQYTRSVFKIEKMPLLSREIMVSFLRTMLLMVCEELLRHEGMTLENDSSSIHDKEIFNQFLQLLSNQEQKRQRVAFYADLLHISPKYLSSVSKKVSGKNPMRWITESTMQDCYSLLKETDMSIKEISNKLGFPNSSFFSQYFREQASVTPLEYRMEHKRVVR
ncbi:MAG: helix-turn-helix transcriptional regulator [Prevotella sp.]|nr:helix-turn-helix transcriptional regulator [Prevotella sp.]MBQ8154041.1 helix-turn-helix transcriptional regulator [Prevotella sp.]MBQ8715459.1 helix-turn-helix transcriptional regulator [Prevotella sp.]